MNINNNKNMIDWKQYKSIVGLLQHHAQEQPENIAYTYLVNGEAENGKVEITFTELNDRAQTLASHLVKNNLENKNILLPFSLFYTHSKLKTGRTFCDSWHSICTISKNLSAFWKEKTSYVYH